MTSYDEILNGYSATVQDFSKAEEWIVLAAEQEGWSGYGWIMAADFLANKGVTWQQVVNRHK